MSKVLYIQSSPIKQISYSIKAADAFIEQYRIKNPEDEIVILNVFDAQLPAFDGPAASAKYAIMHGKAHSQEQKQIWKKIESIIEQFTSADKYVLAVAMWNFSIPYKLKQYIDVLVQPGYTFTYSDQKGYQGLVKGKPAAVFYARGGQYPKGSAFEPYDLQSKYIELILRFIGFEDIQTITIEPTLMAGEKTAQEKLRQAIEQAKELAANL
jgi:FMN-dependent NADH-azoreductase